MLHARLVVRAENVPIDGNGATLVGPGEQGGPDSFRGFGIMAEGRKGVTLRNLKAKGFAAGLAVNRGDHWLIEGCHVSDNYYVPEAGWGNGPRQGGMVLTGLAQSVIPNNKANHVWNGLELDDCRENLIQGNDCHHNHGAGIVFRGDTATHGKITYKPAGGTTCRTPG